MSTVLPQLGEAGLGHALGAADRLLVLAAPAVIAPWELNVGQSIAGRLWFEFLPIHGWTENQVFSEIKRHGQKPFWIYGQTPADCKRLIEAGSVDSQGRCVAMRRMSNRMEE